MKKSQALKAVASLALAMAFAGAPNAKAQTTANANAAYNGWLSAFLVQTDGKTYFCNSLTDRGQAFMWQQTYMITAVEDNYERDPSAANKQLVNDLLVQFTIHNAHGQNDISWDSWNDDIAWAAIALIRGYDITGNTDFRDFAVKAWNMAYNRGWDSTYGGGIWENENDVPNGGKCGLSNWPFVISGVLLYQDTGDSSYLTKSEAIYDWSRNHVFNPATGVVAENWGPNGQVASDNTYNSGLVVSAANSLYKITNNSEYYNDAVVTANHVTGKYAILTADHIANGDFGGDQFFRGLANFARQNNLWNTYSPWLQNNAAAAWSHRRTDYNITANNFSANTTTGNLDAMEALGSVVVQAETARSPISGVHIIVSAQNGVVIDDDNSKAAGVGTVEWGWNGGLQQKWLFTQNTDGSWTITSLFSGLVLDNPGSSTVNGKQMEQYTSNGGANQHWSVTSQSDGSYLIVNKASSDALDNSHSSVNGQPLVQWTQNGTVNQHWFLK